MRHIQRHDLGPCDIRCCKCGALHWKAENGLKPNGEPKPTPFSLCCEKGKVVLPDLPEPPEVLKRMLDTDRGFLVDIREYNKLFAMASSTAQVSRLPPGVSQFHVNGSIHHRICNQQQPKFAHIYILLDPADQVERQRTLLDPHGLGPRGTERVRVLTCWCFGHSGTDFPAYIGHSGTTFNTHIHF